MFHFIHFIRTLFSNHQCSLHLFKIGEWTLYKMKHSSPFWPQSFFFNIFSISFCSRSALHFTLYVSIDRFSHSRGRTFLSLLQLRQRWYISTSPWVLHFVVGCIFRPALVCCWLYTLYFIMMILAPVAVYSSTTDYIFHIRHISCISLQSFHSYKVTRLLASTNLTIPSAFFCLKTNLQTLYQPHNSGTAFENVMQMFGLTLCCCWETKRRCHNFSLRGTS